MNYASSVLFLALLLGGCAGGLHRAAVLGGGPAAEEAVDALLTPSPLPPAAQATAPPLDPDRLAAALHHRVNLVRQTHGLPPLRWARSLAEVAQGHSEDMAQRRFFAHTNTEGEDAAGRAWRAGLHCTLRTARFTAEGVGENLFATHRYSEYRVYHEAVPKRRRYVVRWKSEGALVAQAVRGWLESPSHRANLLSPLYETQGIGIAVGDGQTLFITQNFCPRTPTRLATR